MSDITVFGAGAFGTALAISLAREGLEVSLVARDEAHAREMREAGENARRLPGVPLPEGVRPTASAEGAADICLLAVPMQALAGYLERIAAHLEGRRLVACCKGIDLASGRGPTAVIAEACPSATPAILSGPSFAVDIAAGLPTALTIAAQDEREAEALQHALSTANLRLYRTTDVVGVELGGALKNVIAIAAGVTIGAGLGESARAALMTRGLAEITRFALARGARPETLSGLSGFGDLVLTCTSAKSRNYAFGLALGQGRGGGHAGTVEGIATAKAVSEIAETLGFDLPVSRAVAALVAARITVEEAMEALLARPLRKE